MLPSEEGLISLDTTDKQRHLINENLITKNQQGAIYDYKFQLSLKDAPWSEWLSKPGYFECKNEYLEKIDSWIHSTKNNIVKGLDRFEYRNLINGTTQVFDELYYRFKEKRLRVFRGEYAYHKRIFDNIEFIDGVDGEFIPLSKNDWVIVSLPFSGIGDVHPQMKRLLDEAQKLGIYVLVDCAWLGTCTDILFDFTHPAIGEVCFSLSKGLGLGHMRSGIRYSKVYQEDSIITQHNNMNHLQLASAQLGIYQMNNFSPDFIIDKYYQSYLNMCEDFGFQATKCPHIAIPPSSWDEYINDEKYYKVGVRNLVKKYYKGEI